MKKIANETEPRKPHDLEIISLLAGSSVLLGTVSNLHDPLAEALARDARRARIGDRIIARSRQGATYLLTGKGWAFGGASHG